MNLKRHAFVVFVRASRKYLICHNFHEAFGQTLRNWCYFFRSFESFWLGATWTPFDKDTRKCIQGPLLSWLRSFLTNRYQGVVLRGHHSSWTSVLSGLPQVALLGPILFLIYSNDISRNIVSDTKLFANDMKVYRVLRDTKKDVEELQKDLSPLESWSNDWLQKFNTDKCEVMHISKKNDYSSPQFHPCGNQLKTVSEIKDLRIYVTSNLSWSI